MDHDQIGEKLKASYATMAAHYRADDEIEVTSEHHRHLKSLLSAFSSSFGRPISVLDVGCGTGRYFHCLKNVERLVGLDICPEMLQIAEDPVRSEEVSVGAIELMQGNIHFQDFSPGSFDLIYSFGMFGHGCPVTTDVCRKFYDWLAPGGKILFDAVDVTSASLPRRIWLSLRNGIHSVLPQRFKRMLDKREGVPFFLLNRKDLERLMRSTPFFDLAVSSKVCQSPLWHGVKLECTASKQNG